MTTMASIKNIKTREDFLKVIDDLQGCQDAHDYAAKWKAKTPAKKIWEACIEDEWMFWLGVRWNPKVALAYLAKVIKRIEAEHIKRHKAVPANRIDSFYKAKKGYDDSERYLKEKQIEAFRSAIDWAFHDAKFAAPELSAERDTRLKELRAMW